MSMVIPFMLIPDSHAIRALRQSQKPSLFPLSFFTDASKEEFHSSSIFTFPPSPPLMFGLFPLVRMGYRKLYNAASKWLLSPPTASRRELVHHHQDDLRDVNDRVEVEQEEQIQADDILGALDRGERVRISGTMLCRMFISSISLPAIAQLGGQILLKMAMNWRPLQGFLGVKIKSSLGRSIIVPRLSVLGASVGWSYADYDPVWWRNALGLGLFLVGSDLVGLLHKYLRQVEKRSRRITDRPFDMVDLNNLDLIVDVDSDEEAK
ncbi:hypothetical protein FRC02_010461 [Tulasnella sp. 418]|nr:hypothetical protein FRC02_010461 [Tulasnella sp. 418]